MDSIKDYLVSVIAAVIITGIALSIVGKKGTVGSLIKLLSGLFLIITLISPWTKLDLTNITEYFSDYSTQASAVTAQGEAVAKRELTSIIKDQVEAYILDKASSLGLDIMIQVTLSETNPPAPESVSIQGTVAPYAKKQLEQILSNDLGIAKENQHWT